MQHFRLILLYWFQQPLQDINTYSSLSLPGVLRITNTHVVHGTAKYVTNTRATCRSTQVIELDILWLIKMSQPIQLSDEQFQALLGACRGAPAASAAPPPNNGPSRASVPLRPTVDVDITEGEWAVFRDNWSRFKRMANLVTVLEIRDNLRQCCFAPLNKQLFDVKGSDALDSASEADLLPWVKEIAVKGVHKEVHRTQFVRLSQN